MLHDLILGHGTTIVDPRGGLVTPTGGSAVLKVEPQMLRNGDGPYHGELQYLGLLQELVNKSDAAPREDRTGTGTFSVFGRQIRFDLSVGFPLLTTKKLFTKGIIAELLWMLAGDTNVKTLQEQGVHIWDEWAKEDGSLGPVYGEQWRAWPMTPNYEAMKPYLKRLAADPDAYTTTFASVDQIAVLLENLRQKPNDRGHVVSAWNAAQLDQMALRPCHCLFQFYVEDGKLSCQLYQRSADIFLGVPFNIASYALLTHLIAAELDLNVGDFVHTFGDLHLYANHVEQAKEQLTRCPRPFPTVFINTLGWPGLFNITPSRIAINDYNPHPAIKAEVSI